MTPGGQTHEARTAIGIIPAGTKVDARIIFPEKKSSGKISFDAEIHKDGQVFRAEIVDVSPPQSKKLKGLKKDIKARVIKYNPGRQVYTLKI